MKPSAGIILAFDLGTTNLKAALFDECGRLVAVARKLSPVIRAGNRVELPVESFYEAIRSLVGEIARTADLSGVQAISFASQANSFALFDEHGMPLTPIILWTDARAIGIDQPLNRLADLHASSGVPRVDHEFAESKLRWISAHEPNIAMAARKISFISDLFVEWLTGRHVSEPGLACLTALATRRDANWCEERISQLGLPALRWPELVPPATDLGRILPAVADQLGIPRTAKLYMGCLDQYAGAIGTGCVTSGDVCETTGTVLAAVQCAPANASPSGSQVFEGPSYTSDRIFRMTFSSTSANLLEWYRLHHAGDLTFEQLIDAAQLSSTAAKIGSVSGEIGSAFEKADLAKSPGHVVKGIMLRVCEELASLIADLNAKQVPIRSAGGAARSDEWLQMKSNILGVPVLAASTPEPTCRGAAMLAACGMGMGTIESLAASWCAPRKIFVPANR